MIVMSSKMTIAISEESRDKLRDIEDDRDCTAKTAIEQLIEREHRHITTQDIQEQILLELIQESDYSLVNMESGMGAGRQDIVNMFPDKEDFVNTGESQD